MALVGYEQEKVKIEAQIAEIHAQLGTANLAFIVTDGAAPKRRRMSAAARKRIGEATKRRWAAFRKQKGETEAAAAQKPKHKMSAAGKARIVAATKARWRRFHKAQKAAAAKKATPKAHKAAVKKTAPVAAAPVTW
jgi:hypothetical protein